MSFKIKIGELVKSYGEPVEDVCNELTKFQLGINTYCYERNRKMGIEIGEWVEEIEYDPDVAIWIKEDIPIKIDKLIKGEDIEIVESGVYEVTLRNKGEEIECEVEGYKHRVDRDEVIKELGGFIIKVIDDAYKLGYIGRIDREDYIYPLYGNYKNRYGMSNLVM